MRLIIRFVSYRRGIISVAIGGDGEGTTRVAIDIIIIVVFRIQFCFKFVIIFINRESFGRSISLASGGMVCGIIVVDVVVDAIISVSTRVVVIVAVEIIIGVVFGIVFIIIIIVENGEGPTRKPVNMIIIVGDDEANGPIIMVDRVGGLGTAVVVTIAVVMVITK